MKYAPVVVEGHQWTFEHLSPFSFPYEILVVGAPLTVFVDVVFSCHCFSRGPAKGVPLPAAEWVYATDKETRILDAMRYRHSNELLPGVIKDFDSRKILFASDENYMTIDATAEDGQKGHYQVFFTV